MKIARSLLSSRASTQGGGCSGPAPAPFQIRGAGKVPAENPNGGGLAIMLPRLVVPYVAKVATTNAQAAPCFALHDVQLRFEYRAFKRSEIASIAHRSAHYASLPPRARRRLASALLPAWLYFYPQTLNGATRPPAGARKGLPAGGLGTFPCLRALRPRRGPVFRHFSAFHFPTSVSVFED